MILYVSGPMTGYENYNFEEFAKVAARLRAAGHTVINPAENWAGSTGISRETCMRLDIHQVLVAEGIASLSYWEWSSGARLEHEIAAEIGLEIRPWREWLC